MTPLERAARALAADMRRVSKNLTTDVDGRPRRNGVWSSGVASDRIEEWARRIDAMLEEG